MFEFVTKATEKRDDERTEDPYIVTSGKPFSGHPFTYLHGTQQYNHHERNTIIMK